MPIYKFKCKACAEGYEDYRSMHETEETGECISCGSNEIERGEQVESKCGCGCADESSGCGCC